MRERASERAGGGRERAKRRGEKGDRDGEGRQRGPGEEIRRAAKVGGEEEREEGGEIMMEEEIWREEERQKREEREARVQSRR